MKAGFFFCAKREAGARAQYHGRRRRHLSACSRSSEPDREQRDRLSRRPQTISTRSSSHRVATAEISTNPTHWLCGCSQKPAWGCRPEKAGSSKGARRLNPAQLPCPALRKLAIAAYPPYAEYQKARRPADCGLCTTVGRQAATRGELQMVAGHSRREAGCGKLDLVVRSLVVGWARP